MSKTMIGDLIERFYTVRFKEAVYVLHVFQKKSKKGIETTRSHVNLIKERLKWAIRNHAPKSG